MPSLKTLQRRTREACDAIDAAAKRDHAADPRWSGLEWARGPEAQQAVARWREAADAEQYEREQQRRRHDW